MNNPPPLVSIIVASYNHEKYVLTMLQSVLDDNYLNKELVIINDGSKDNSDAIILGWIEKHKNDLPISYKYQDNQGVCKTLNHLIDSAKGKYLLPLPSDDILVPGTIAERIQFMEEHPEKMVLITDSIVIDEHGNQIMDSSIVNYNHGDKIRFDNDASILLSTLVSPQISGPNIIIKKDIYNIIGRSRENLIAEDWYFYQRAAAHNLMTYVDKICGKYRVHSNNSSGKNMSGSYKMAWTIVLTYWYNWSIMPNLKHKYIALKEMTKWLVRYSSYKLKS